MTRTALITGAAGLIGRPTIVALRERGFEIVATSRRDKVAGADRTISANLLDSAERERAVHASGASHLVHLAWHDDPKDRWNSTANEDWSITTRALVAEFAEAGGQRAVCAGSCAEYDWTSEVLSEETALAPLSTYGQTKANTGRALVAEAPRLGISLAWARIFFCYGPGEPRGRLLGDLIRGLSRGEVVNCTDGEQERDFLHTTDVGRALVHVLDGPVTGAINIASGVATPVRDLIDITASQMGGAALVNLGAIPRPASDPVRLVADIERLRATGFAPMFDLQTGIANCISVDTGAMR